ncbi:MAG: HTTM domain-containing protein, partial [Cyclobacteriaceae bacterium]|nr:HTTM domain-containing protein [Cyclobacteriaceae bacterium]
MSLKSRIENLITKPRSIAPLVIFRILFGLLMLFSLVRFLYNGWVEEFYVLPVFNFTYYGFDWLQPLPQEVMYLVFAFMIVACILIILGWYYRWAIGTFFILFSYVELLDKTYYLNHYYFISLVSFILIWLPASSRFSLDIKFGRVKEITQIPAWTIYILMFQIGVVYFFAGIAKINS